VPVTTCRSRPRPGRRGGFPRTAGHGHWQDSLIREPGRIDDTTALTISVDLRGDEHGDLAAHTEMRTVIPLTLAADGLRAALLDLFDPVDLPFPNTRGRACGAVVHVDHDADMMTLYGERLGRANERFFSGDDAADAWIQASTCVGRAPAREPRTRGRHHSGTWPGGNDRWRATQPENRKLADRTGSPRVRCRIL
jgi:hypothetical protein